MSTAQSETLAIDGMSCDHCVELVRGALEDIDGVTVDDVEVGSATVSYDVDTVSHDDLVAAVETAGFSVAG